MTTPVSTCYHVDHNTSRYKLPILLLPVLLPLRPFLLLIHSSLSSPLPPLLLLIIFSLSSALPPLLSSSSSSSSLSLSSSSSESTQLEDPRAQWQQEQEVMLREYLEVAHHAISAQEEIYQVKEQRLLLAQQEYQLLHDTWRNKSTSQTSCEETRTHTHTYSRTH